MLSIAGKRNTSLAFFTSYERSLLKSTWGSQSTRLNRDSFLPFASCRLCLLPARTPVACASNGDFFCRECAMSNLLAQRKEIKRLEKENERKRADEADEDVREDEEARLKAVEEFEKVQMGLEAKFGDRTIGRNIVGRADGKVVFEETEEIPGEPKGKKRKFELDEQELLRIAKEERSKARKVLEHEKVRHALFVSRLAQTHVVSSLGRSDQDCPPLLLGPLLDPIIESLQRASQCYQTAQT